MALNLGFPPQYDQQGQVFISCGRQDSSRAADIAERLSQKIPVSYDNGGQGDVSGQIADSSAVVFFVDSKLFESDDADVCHEFELSKKNGKPCVCVWCEDMTDFDVRKLSDSMYNLWNGLAKMPLVNAYDNATVHQTVLSIMSAAGVMEGSPLQDTGFHDITASGAGSVDGSDSFNSLGTDSFDGEMLHTDSNVGGASVQSTVSARQPVNNSADVIKPTETGLKTRRKRSPFVVIAVVLLIIAICMLLFSRCDLIGTGGAQGTESTESHGTSSREAKSMYFADIQSADDVQVKDEVKFGSFENQKIEWIVLDKDGDNLLLLSKNVLAQKPFDDEYPPTEYTQKQLEKIDEEHLTTTVLSRNPYNYVQKYQFGVNWENCSLREWLNGDFINSAFTSDEQNKINKTYVYTPDVTVKPVDEGVNMLMSYTMSCGEDTMDKVFVLSEDECNKYLPASSDRGCGSSWWLRSNGYGFGRKEAIVNDLQQNLDVIDDAQMQIVDESGKPLIHSERRSLSNGTYYYCYVGEHVYHESGVRPSLCVNVG